jgi:hypothetical protein
MPSRVTRLVGVYDADGTIIGELTYLARSSVGKAHCSLCDITHGRLRERADWREARSRLPVPFETFHRDDQPDAVRAVLAGTTPAVVAELDGAGHRMLLGPTELEACGASPDTLVDALAAAVVDRGLTW